MTERLATVGGIRYVGVRGGTGVRGLVQGVTLREDGGPPDTRRRLRLAWGERFRLVAGVQQVHTTRVVRVDLAARAQRAEGVSGEVLWGEADGMVTQDRGALLTLTVADCLPLFLVAPGVPVVGLLHAGWRGVAGRILREGLGALREGWGVNAREVSLHIGPGIEGRCYPVDVGVRNEILASLSSASREAYLSGEGGTVDLRQVVRLQALEEGIAAAAVTISPRCTACQGELFHSYRRDGARAGRMLAFLGLVGAKGP